MTLPSNSIEQLKRALHAGLIDQATFDAATGAVRPHVDGGGAIAQGMGSTAVGAQGVSIAGDNPGEVNTGVQIAAAEHAQIVYAERGATVVVGEAPVVMTAVDRATALGRYLQHVISQNRYLQLQGIRSGGKVVNIELDRIYVALRTNRQRSRHSDVDWLTREAATAPGERVRGETLEKPEADTTVITVNEALAEQKRLVVLGDPGSGKTTLLRYLALLYGRACAQGVSLVDAKLGLPESGWLPVFLPLRQIGRYLAEHHGKDDGTDGHAMLLAFLERVLKNERVDVAARFFDEWLQSGRAVVLLDGLDEVADPALRRRVSRLVDAFTRAYPDCRYVVTSRIVGYTDASQLTEGYATATVRDFTIDDIRAFLSQWHRLVAIGQMGPGESAEASAESQTTQLLASIEKNDRVRELAINPLMLTVIALIHRDRVKLPDRRAELYQEAVDVLLGKWDEARGVQESLILNDRPFDISDRRLVLQHLALAMHEAATKEIDADRLREILAEQLSDALSDGRELDLAVARLLHVIKERTGLLIARAEGSYAFSHLTFQEYLAALAVAGRDDYVEYTLERCADAWWREVILLEAGYLSTQSKEKTTRLIRAIADAKNEPTPHHNLVLAAECVRDAGQNRIVGDLESDLRTRLRRELEHPVARGPLGALQTLFTRGMTTEGATRRRIAAAEALGAIGGSQFWTSPHGEPEWVVIPEGDFTMGEASAHHRVTLPGYAIAKAPLTNAQYQLFVQVTGHEPPSGWNGRRAPRGQEGHPVVNVSWHDAMTYCRWLAGAVGKSIDLPSEAEWEKAARGVDDVRGYPWGDEFGAARCNVHASGFGGTTPVGIFLGGASPFGCLDMAGNVWEWTRSLWGTDVEKPAFGYPYDPSDSAREDPKAPDDVLRVVRGGSWLDFPIGARCSYRFGYLPDCRNFIGFRVVLRSSPVR